MADLVTKTVADSINLGLAQRSLADRIQADYTVMAVTIILWVGIFLYLLRLDRKSKEITKS